MRVRAEQLPGGGGGQDGLLRLKEELQLLKNYKSHEHALGK